MKPFVDANIEIILLDLSTEDVITSSDEIILPPVFPFSITDDREQLTDL